MNNYLLKFKDSSKVYRLEEFKDLGDLSAELDANNIDNDLMNTVGYYDILNDYLYAIFSFKNKNYLFLKDQLLEITEEIKVVADVNWSLGQMSVFKVFKGEEIESSVEYKSVHEGILIPFDFEENWEEVNFGFQLGEWVGLAKERNHGLIFPNGAE